jgi:hypothetical protein
VVFGGRPGRIVNIALWLGQSTLMNNKVALQIAKYNKGAKQ